MADKIANFEDYKKRDVKQGNKVESPKKEAEKEPKVSQETMEIEIEDPYQFLNAEERDEYIRQRHIDEQRRMEDSREAEHEHEQIPEDEQDEKPEMSPEDERDDYDEEYDDEEYQEESKSGINMELLVKAASIITGIVILLLAGMLFKVKVYDRYLAPDPDEVHTSAAAIPEGFIEKNDTVTVTGASLLNLRSGPDTDSSVMGLVAEGDELKRIAVSQDGSWALVEVEGELYYASMKYLK